MVVDFGGGTFDATLLRIEDKEYRVLSTHGDTHLGGQDMDQNVMNSIVDGFKKKQVIRLYLMNPCVTASITYSRQHFP